LTPSPVITARFLRFFAFFAFFVVKQIGLFLIDVLALQFSKTTAGAEEPLVLVRQFKWVNEPKTEWSWSLVLIDNLCR